MDKEAWVSNDPKHLSKWRMSIKRVPYSEWIQDTDKQWIWAKFILQGSKWNVESANFFLKGNILNVDHRSTVEAIQENM